MPGEAEEMVVAVEPERARREAQSFDESQLRPSSDRAGPRSEPAGPRLSVAWPVGQEVDALVAGGDERLDVALRRPARARRRCCSASLRTARSRNSTAVFQWATPLLSTLKSSVASPASVKPRMAIAVARPSGPARDQLVILGDPAAQRHRHAVGDLPVRRGPRPDVAMLPGRRADRVVTRAGRRLHQLLLWSRARRWRRKRWRRAARQGSIRRIGFPRL